MRSSISSPSFRRQLIRPCPILPVCNPMRGVAVKNPEGASLRRRHINRSAPAESYQVLTKIPSRASCRVLNLSIFSKIGTHVADADHAMVAAARHAEARVIHSGNTPNARARCRGAMVEASDESRTASGAAACKSKRPARGHRRTKCSAPESPPLARNHYLSRRCKLRSKSSRQ